MAGGQIFNIDYQRGVPIDDPLNPLGTKCSDFQEVSIWALIGISVVEEVPR